MVSKRERLLHYEHREFKDELDLAYNIHDKFLNENTTTINIVADDETIRYLSTLFMSDFDYNPIYIQMDSDNQLYCLRLYDDTNLEIFKFSHMDQLETSMTFAHETDILDTDFNFDQDVLLFTYHDEDYDFVHGDVSDLD